MNQKSITEETEVPFVSPMEDFRSNEMCSQASEVEWEGV